MIDLAKKTDPVITRNPTETERFGEKLAESLAAGDVVALFGEMGSGKTTLIRGICHGLDVGDRVTSPTFTLIHEYTGRVPVYHFDLYRIDRVQDLDELGLEEYASDAGVCLIEWAEKAGDRLPEPCLKVYLENRFEKPDGMSRYIKVEYNEAFGY